jgi:Na+/melibiose symporter-like transporter
MKKPKPMTKGEAWRTLAGFGLLFLTGAAFAFVEDRVNQHGFDIIAILVTVIFSLLLIVGILKLGRMSRRERMMSSKSEHEKNAASDSK